MKNLLLVLFVTFCVSCGGGSNIAPEVVEPGPMEPETVEPGSPEICHEQEDIIDFLDDVSCSGFLPSPPGVTPLEGCEGERLVRMIQAPVLRIAPLHIRDRDREIIQEVVVLLNKGMPEGYKITIGPDLTTPHAETRQDWLNSINDTAPGEIHLSVGNLQPKYASAARSGEADWVNGVDGYGGLYIERGIVRLNITGRIASPEFPELDAWHQYDCDRYIGQTASHEILHVLGFVGHVAEHWNRTATATTVDQIPAVTVMGISNEWCANEDKATGYDFPLEYLGSMDKDALHALYSVDSWVYAEEIEAERSCE